MFKLYELEDCARVLPHLFVDEVAAITTFINSKYCNKVIPNEGLCIVLYDILHVSQGRVHPGDGSAYYRVRFRFVVFSVFIGEVIQGRIIRSNADGIVVSLGFFQNVLLHSSVLSASPRITCEYNSDKREWFWRYEEHQLFLSLHDTIRFRVFDIRFESLQAIESQKEEMILSAEGTPVPKHKNKNKPPLLCVYGTIDGDGLGLVSWWT
jgi:DNA-directed RNA polymerase III subunit RPC8